MYVQLYIEMRKIEPKMKMYSCQKKKKKKPKMKTHNKVVVLNFSYGQFIQEGPNLYYCWIYILLYFSYYPIKLQIT